MEFFLLISTSRKGLFGKKVERISLRSSNFARGGALKALFLISEKVEENEGAVSF